MNFNISHLMALLQLDNKIEIYDNKLISRSKKDKLSLTIHFDNLQLPSKQYNKTMIISKDDIICLKEIFDNCSSEYIDLTKIEKTGYFNISNNWWLPVQLKETEWKQPKSACLQKTVFNKMRKVSDFLGEIVLVRDQPYHIFDNDKKSHVKVYFTNEWTD